MATDPRIDLPVVGEWRRDPQGRWAVLMPLDAVKGRVGVDGAPNPRALVQTRRGAKEIVALYRHAGAFYASEKREYLTYCYVASRQNAG